MSVFTIVVNAESYVLAVVRLRIEMSASNGLYTAQNMRRPCPAISETKKEIK